MYHNVPQYCVTFMPAAVSLRLRAPISGSKSLPILVQSGAEAALLVGITKHPPPTVSAPRTVILNYWSLHIIGRLGKIRKKLYIIGRWGLGQYSTQCTGVGS